MINHYFLGRLYWSLASVPRSVYRCSRWSEGLPSQVGIKIDRPRRFPTLFFRTEQNKKIYRIGKSSLVEVNKDVADAPKHQNAYCDADHTEKDINPMVKFEII